MGTSPGRRDRLKRSEIGLAIIGAATLQKKGSKPSDPDVFVGGDIKKEVQASSTEWIKLILYQFTEARS